MKCVQSMVNITENLLFENLSGGLKVLRCQIDTNNKRAASGNYFI